MMGVLSLEVILGSLTFTGSLMAAGKLQEILPQRPITYKGANFVNLRCWRLRFWSRVYLVIHPGNKALFPVIDRGAAALWRADDRSDRRRGHADGDFAFEFVCRPFGGGDGICA